MKKVISILFVVLLLINASGYYLISIGLSLNDSEQSLKLSNDEYSGSDAIIIKLPLSLPYVTNDNTYENTNGKFVYNHETYRIVKKRMMNDTMFIVCVKDQVEGKIRTQMNELAKSLSDSPQNHKQTSSALFFIRDYLPTSCGLGNFSNLWSIQIGYRTAQYLYSYLFEFSILRPPQD